MVSRLSFSSPNGEVHFSLQKMPGCCGVAIIFAVLFSPKSRKRKALFEDFHKHVTTCMTPFDFQRCKLLMSDYVEGDVDKFCKHNGWLGGEPTFNRKSGNRIIVYEYDRENQFVSAT